MVSPLTRLKSGFLLLNPMMICGLVSPALFLIMKGLSAKISSKSGSTVVPIPDSNPDISCSPRLLGTSIFRFVCPGKSRLKASTPTPAFYFLCEKRPLPSVIRGIGNVPHIEQGIG